MILAREEPSIVKFKNPIEGIERYKRVLSRFLPGIKNPIEGIESKLGLQFQCYQCILEPNRGN